MPDRIGPPPRPPTVRPVDRDLEAADRARRDGLITHGSSGPLPTHRQLLAPWARDALMVLKTAAPGSDRSLTPQPKLLRRLCDDGLVTLVEQGDRIVGAGITDAGRQALVRGWYPCD